MTISKRVKFSILLLLVQISLPGIYGTSPTFIPPPPPNCTGGTELCKRTCYSPSTHVCLKYDDGSGGTICPIGDSFCGGKCLAPSSGKVCVTRDGEEAGGAYDSICDPGQRICGIGYCYSPETHACLNGHAICKKGESYCGRQCYMPSPSVQCTVGNGWGFVCNVGEKVCGSAGCYSPEDQICNEAQHRICDKTESCGK